MAEPRTMPNGKDRRKSSLKSAGSISLEHVAGSKADKHRGRKSIASQFAHPLTGENVKERQVKKFVGYRKKSCFKLLDFDLCCMYRHSLLYLLQSGKKRQKNLFFQFQSSTWYEMKLVCFKRILNFFYSMEFIPFVVKKSLSFAAAKSEGKP